MATHPSLLPREHGAYAELAFPLVTGLALAKPSIWALALGAAAVAVFLANEPVAILLGIRGKRLRDELGPAARKRAGVLLGAGLLLAGFGVLGAGRGAWPWLLFPALSGAVLVPLVLKGKQKTLGGELVVVTAFSTLLLPLALASGANEARAILASGVWWISLTLGTLEVHAIKARVKNTVRSRWTRWGSPAAAWIAVLASAAIVLARLSPLLTQAASALFFPALATLALSTIRVHPRHLKRVGWTLVAANSVALVVLLIR